MYKVIRHFQRSGRKQIVDTGLTLEQAQAHCQDPQTSSRTCTDANACRRTARSGPWFDGYKECNR